MDALSTPPSADPPRLAETVMLELRALSTVQDRLDYYAAQRFGINRTDLRALDLIGQAGAISPTALAVALGMSTGATSAVLNRLEAAGYARREPDPDHRRRTLVRQTPRAEELAEEIFAPVIGGTLSTAATYSDAALASIAEFLSTHRELLYSYLTTVSQDGNADTGTPQARVTTPDIAVRETGGPQAKERALPCRTATQTQACT